MDTCCLSGVVSGTPSLSEPLIQTVSDVVTLHIRCWWVQTSATFRLTESGLSCQSLQFPARSSSSSLLTSEPS